MRRIQSDNERTGRSSCIGLSRTALKAIPTWKTAAIDIYRDWYSRMITRRMEEKADCDHWQGWREKRFWPGSRRGEEGRGENDVDWQQLFAWGEQRKGHDEAKVVVQSKEGFARIASRNRLTKDHVTSHAIWLHWIRSNRYRRAAMNSLWDLTKEFLNNQALVSRGLSGDKAKGSASHFFRE